MKDSDIPKIDEKAVDTVELLVNGFFAEAVNQYSQAVDHFGYRKFNSELLRVASRRAARARRDGHDGIISRLQEALTNHLPTGLDTSVVRAHFATAGAIGHRPARPKAPSASTLRK